MATKTAPDPLTFRSGFCGPGNPPDSHSRCHGTAVTRKGTLRCVCDVCTAALGPAPTLAEVDRYHNHVCIPDGGLCKCPEPARHQPPQGEAPPKAEPPPPPHPAGPTRSAGAFYAELFIRQCVDDLEDAARQLNAHALNLPLLTFDEVIGFLERIEVIRQAIQASEAAFTDAAWKAKGDRYGDTEVPGVGAVTLRRGSTRKTWDHEALAGEVIDRHMIEREGELPDPDLVKRWLLDAAGIGYWRVGALKEMGVDVDDYCATEPGRVSIQFHRPGVGNRLLSSKPDDAL